MQRTNRKTSESDSQSQYAYSRLDKEDSEIPWKSILFAIFLMVIGIVFFTFALLLITGHIDAKHSDRLYPLLMLGTLVFIPGFYYTRIAFMAWRYPGNREYKFSEIPKWDEQ
mmetsp:Transcript_5750/g.8040  ORF Transcript_5750/g.8040 Transcript_5750/m.8040 type:complete len:112 (-) Transcript_5750:19-354(-)